MTVDAYIGVGTDEHFRKHLNALPTFRNLVTTGPGITDEGAELMSRCTQLRELHLVDTRITDEGLRHIAKLKNLNWLVIDNAMITDAGLNHLKELKALNGLHIVSTKTTSDGLSMLKELPRLHYLQLISENIKADGTVIISGLPALRSLRLASLTATDRDLMALTNSRGLEQFSFDLPHVTKEAMEELQQSLSGCKFQNFFFYHTVERVRCLSEICLDLYERQDFSRALDIVDDMLMFSPLDAAAHGARAFINFELGNFFDFRGDLASARDNAQEFGDHELLRMADYYLGLESDRTIRSLIYSEKPQSVLLNRLRETSNPLAPSDSEAAFIKRLELALSRPNRLNNVFFENLERTAHILYGIPQTELKGLDLKSTGRAHPKKQTPWSW